MSLLSRLTQFGIRNKTNRRRHSSAGSMVSCEALEVRQMLSATAIEISNEVTIDESTLAVGTYREQPKSVTPRQVNRDTPDFFVKPWEGTWGLISDIPFLEDGTVTFHQFNPDTNGTKVTARTGLSDATVKKVRVVGDVLLILQLRVFNNISNKTVNVTGAFILDTANMVRFEGAAKVQGGTGGHEHTFQGFRLSGPQEAMVEVESGVVPTVIRKGKVVRPPTVAFGLMNNGDAGVPRGGAQILIVFDDQAGDPDKSVEFVRIASAGFVAPLEHIVVDGHTALVGITGPILNYNRRTAIGVSIQFFLPTGVTQLAVTGKLVDTALFPTIAEQTKIAVVT